MTRERLALVRVRVWVRVRVRVRVKVRYRVRIKVMARSVRVMAKAPCLPPRAVARRATYRYSASPRATKFEDGSRRHRYGKAISNRTASSCLRHS